jgi:ribosome-associated protein
MKDPSARLHAPLRSMPRAKRNANSADHARDFAKEAAQLLADRKCDDIRMFDVRGLSQVCDFMVIASGTSERQMKTLSEELQDLGEERDMAVFRRAADTGNTWLVVDCVDVVIHLFEPNLRLYYDLEHLWTEAPVVDWRRTNQKKTHRHKGEVGLAANANVD